MAKKAIITQRLVLREIKVTDQIEMLSILMNDRIKRTYMLPDFPTEQDAIPLFNKLANLSNGTDRYVYGIALQDKIIGFMNDVEIKDGKIEVGYVIHPDHHNRGYATEALTALIDRLHQVGFHTVVAGYFEGNLASARVMEKAGMVRIEYTDEMEYRGQVHRCIYYEHKTT